MNDMRGSRHYYKVMSEVIAANINGSFGTKVT